MLETSSRNYLLILILALFLILQSTIAFAEWQWTCQALESTSEFGEYSSLLEGADANMHIAHYDATADNLRYCEGTAEDWTCQAIDSTGDVGQWISITEGADTNMHISHYDSTNTALRYCEGKAADWTCQTIDNTGNLGSNTSNVEGADGNIHISYFDSTPNFDLRYCEGAGEEWTCQTIDSTNQVGWQTSIAAGVDGNIHISHHENTNDDLRYCEGAGAEWTCQTIESISDRGWYTSIIEGSDNDLHISHYDAGISALRYCKGKNTEWTCRTIDNTGTVGSFTSITEGVDANIHFSYQLTGISYDLRYCEGAGTEWTCQTVESANLVGERTSIAAGADGNLHISHYDITSDDLRYCEGWFNTPPVANITTVDGFSDRGSLLFSYVDDGNLTVRFYAYGAEGNDLNFNMWYGVAQSAKTTAIVEDLNLSSAICDSDTNSVLGTYCEWDWDILDLADGNYFITIEVNNGTFSDTNSTEYVDGIQIHIASPAPGVGTPASCGDDSCDFASRNETAVTCPADCSAVCGDSACTHTESPETCALDCIGCGDGKCGTGEDCSNCENDCGVCETQEPPIEEPVEGPVEPGIGEPLNGSSNGSSVQEQPIECIVDSDCANNNPCTIKTCVGTTCHTVPKANGSSCGFARECVNVVCTQMSIIPTIPEVDTTTQIAVIAAAALIIGTAYIYLHSIV
jgi:hypothetical protein